MRSSARLCTVALLFVVCCGFNLQNAIVPQEEIQSGGVPKDGIPAILKPRFVRPDQADFLGPEDQVIGVNIENQAKAYPVRILNWHEAVNDIVGDRPILVTFWPLTQTGVVYSRTIQGDTYTFGISGLLYKSNVIFYDHQTESLWSQLMGKAIAGRLASTPLEEIPSGRMSWESWRERYPDTQVLSTETGYQRDYSVDPYEGYYRLGSIWFPVGDVRRDLSPKERVLGIEMDGRTKAYPLSALKDKPGVFTDTIGGKAVKIEINSEGEIVDVRTETEKPVSHLFSYWFAWQAFHPETQVYESGK